MGPAAALCPARKDCFRGMAASAGFSPVPGWGPCWQEMGALPGSPSVLRASAGWLMKGGLWPACSPVLTAESLNLGGC